jgi:hypothetical protein
MLIFGRSLPAQRRFFRALRCLVHSRGPVKFLFELVSQHPRLGLLVTKSLVRGEESDGLFALATKTANSIMRNGGASTHRLLTSTILEMSNRSLGIEYQA